MVRCLISVLYFRIIDTCELADIFHSRAISQWEGNSKICFSLISGAQKVGTTAPRRVQIHPFVGFNFIKIDDICDNKFIVDFDDNSGSRGVIFEVIGFQKMPPTQLGIGEWDSTAFLTTHCNYINITIPIFPCNVPLSAGLLYAVLNFEVRLISASVERVLFGETSTDRSSLHNGKGNGSSNSSAQAFTRSGNDHNIRELTPTRASSCIEGSFANYKQQIPLEYIFGPVRTSVVNLFFPDYFLDPGSLYSVSNVICVSNITDWRDLELQLTVGSRESYDVDGKLVVHTSPLLIEPTQSVSVLPGQRVYFSVTWSKGSLCTASRNLNTRSRDLRKFVGEVQLVVSRRQELTQTGNVTAISHNVKGVHEAQRSKSEISSPSDLIFTESGDAGVQNTPQLFPQVISFSISFGVPKNDQLQSPYHYWINKTCVTNRSIDTEKEILLVKAVLPVFNLRVVGADKWKRVLTHVDTKPVSAVKRAIRGAEGAVRQAAGASSDRSFKEESPVCHPMSVMSPVDGDFDFIEKRCRCMLMLGTVVGLPMVLSSVAHRMPPGFRIAAHSLAPDGWKVLEPTETNDQYQTLSGALRWSDSDCFTLIKEPHASLTQFLWLTLLETSPAGGEETAVGGALVSLPVLKTYRKRIVPVEILLYVYNHFSLYDELSSNSLVMKGAFMKIEPQD